MEKRHIRLFILLAIGLSITQACSKKISPDDKVLAHISNKSITLGDFKNRIAKLPSYYRNIVDRNKKRFLDETIVEMLFYEEALRKNLDKDKEVRDVINEARKKILVAKLIKNEVEDRIKIDEEEMRRFYEEHKAEFKTPQLWRASHILMATEEDARAVLEELSKGASFEELAKTRSSDATAARGGDIGYFRAGQLVPDFEKACFKLKVGEVSGVIRTQFGYHIIKLTDRKESTTESYERVKRAIEEELKKRHRSELFDKLVHDLKVKYRVRVEEDVFKTLETMAAKEEKGD